MDFIAEKLMERKSAAGVVTLLEAGVPVSTMVSTFLLSGMGAGKWTPDFALLLAGPTARIMELMAKGAKVSNYNMGP